MHTPTRCEVPQHLCFIARKEYKDWMKYGCAIPSLPSLGSLNGRGARFACVSSCLPRLVEHDYSLYMLEEQCCEKWLFMQINHLHWVNHHI